MAVKRSTPIPLAVRTKAWVLNRSIADIVDLNPDEDADVLFVCVLVCLCLCCLVEIWAVASQ